MFRVPPPSPGKQRGNVMMLTSLSLSAVVATAALSVDYAALGTWRSELQHAADAAALAAAGSLPDGAYQAAAVSYAAKNKVANASLILAAADVEGGIYDFDTGAFTAAADGKLNAVRVTARRDDANPDGRMPQFFSQVLGIERVAMTAESKAVIDHRISGVRHGTSSPLVPFLVDADTFGGIVDGEIHPTLGEQVTFFPGDAESRSCGSGDGNDASSPTIVPGNFGLADLDGGSNSVTELRDWIENGYPDNVRIPDDTGYLTVLGSTGVDAGIKNSVEARIGDTIAVMVYDQATDNGSNAQFRVRSFVAIELTGAHLTGNVGNRYIRGVVREMPAAWVIGSATGMANSSVSHLRLVR